MAGRIPDQFIDELLARVDIVDVVGERVQLKRAGANHHALCPFHSEKTPSFTVSQSKQFYHCFGCGAHGTAIRFLMEYDRMDFREAVASLAQMAGMELPESAREGPVESHEPLYRVLERAGECYRRWLRRHPDRDRAVDYLRRRGLSGEIAARYALGFAPPGWDNLLRELGERDNLARAGLLVEREGGRGYDRFRDRIMFPIRDRRGRIIGFGGRVLGDGEPKYLNSPETPVFHKGQGLYGLYEALEADRHPPDIVVVEGYMDVVALAQFGITRAVATLGTSTGTRQVERLFRVTGDLVFCFDGDEAGRQAAWRALESSLPALREGRQVRFLFLPEGEDPDSLVRRDGPEGFERLLADAAPLSDWLFERLTAEVDLASMDGRARLVERAIPLIRRLPPDVYRRMIVDRLAGLARLEHDYLEAVIEGRESAPSRTPSRPARSTPEEPAVRRTPVRLAVALLLQRPALGAGLSEADAGLADSDLPGAPLLAQLLEITRDEPHITTGALLERFRDSEHEAALWRLATWDHLVPEDGLEQELADALGRIRALRNDKRLQYLNERFQSGDLTRDEWNEWVALKRG
ncbi:DNA primase [wastewater metagenome]|uniref:DNA primase n=2 Tax=unclassified sequences TaxID=12908 RepID=A0A5B8R9U1_9ZZZZ|nr:DNA primase [Arhodomonas sp. KWT]QEA05959.1 DNA primase [uncultured organism]